MFGKVLSGGFLLIFLWFWSWSIFWWSRNGSNFTVLHSGLIGWNVKEVWVIEMANLVFYYDSSRCLWLGVSSAGLGMGFIGFGLLSVRLRAVG